MGIDPPSRAPLNDSNLFSGEPGLSSDLEWLLSSGPGAQAELAQALATAAFPTFYRLGLAWTNDQESAAALALEIFIAALHRAYTYQAGQSVNLWLSGVARAELRRAGPSSPFVGPWAELDNAQREALLFFWLARGAEEDAPTVQMALSVFPEALDWLEQNVPSPSFSAEDLKVIAAEALGQAQRRRRSSGHRSQVLELLWIGLAILGVSGLLWQVNLWLPDATPAPDLRDSLLRTVLVTRLVTVLPTPQVVIAPSPIQPMGTVTAAPGDTLDTLARRLGVSTGEMAWINRRLPDRPLTPGEALLLPPEVTPVAPVTPPALPEALTLNSSSEDIRARLVKSPYLLKTLWVDLTLRYFGPPGFRGNPEVYRVQAWKPDHFLRALILIGPPGAVPEEAWLFDERNQRQAFPEGGLAPYFDWGKGPSEAYRSGQLMQRAQALRFLGLPAKGIPLWDEPSFVPLSQEEIGSMPTLGVDAFDGQGQRVARLWLEAQRGTLLRMQWYSPLDRNHVLWEYRVNQVEFDQPIPPELLDPGLPWRGGYARDGGGGPLPLAEERFSPPSLPPLPRMAQVPPPPEFEPASSSLTFEFPPTFKPGSRQVAPALMPVNIFAEPYFLGQAALPPSLDLLCTRSPNGQRLVLGPSWNSPYWGNETLQWFNLEGDFTSHTVHLPGAAAEFVFAPDSRRLALFTIGTIQSELSIFDIETGELELILPVFHVSSLTWSPDGQFLGMIAFLPDATQFQDFVVVRLQDKAIVFRRPIFDAEQPDLTGTPIETWNVPFPVEMGGLGECAQAPGERRS